MKKKKDIEVVDRESFVGKFGEEPQPGDDIGTTEEELTAWETGLHIWLIARKALREEQWKEHK